MLNRWREAIVREILREQQLSEAAVEPFVLRPVDVSDAPFRRAALWAKALPFVVFIWALTGAFYPAIDLCAGEKERGTLETLLSSPALRTEIVWGKLLTVVTFSTVTALLNLASLGLTGVLLFGRLAEMDGVRGALQIGPPPWAAVGWLLLAIIPISALFSALSLAIAAFARSSKEGQYYLMPLLLITLPLMILPLLPAAELDMGSSLIPVSGVMLWLRTLIEGDYWSALRFSLPVIAVTFGCCWMAVRWAERQFQSEAVLFRESERVGVRLWLQHLMRDREDTPSVTDALACGLILLLITFFVGLRMSMPEQWWQIAKTILVTQLGLIAAPALIMAVMLTRNPRKTLLLRPAPWHAIPAAILLAIALNPMAVLLGQLIQATYPPSEELVKSLEPLMVALHSAPWWQVLLVFALSPAICEELAFRGFILSGLRRLGSPTAAILISSLLFGVSHGILQQSLSTMVVGVVIGFIALRSGSLFPCIAFHFTHNGISVMSSRWAQSLGTAEGWLEWFLQRSDGQLVDFQYNGPTTVGSAVIAGLLLYWFYRMPYEASDEEGRRKSLTAD